MGSNVDMNNQAPNKDEIKLIVDNSILALEGRMTEKINAALTSQNKLYLDEILAITKQITSMETRQNRFDERLKAHRGLITTVAAAAGVISGFIGFLIGQLNK